MQAGYRPCPGPVPAPWRRGPTCVSAILRRAAEKSPRLRAAPLIRRGGASAGSGVTGWGGAARLGARHGGWGASGNTVNLS